MRIKFQLALGILFVLAAPAGAQNVPLFRTILALYDSTEDYNRREDHNLIHNNAELALNYLGMKVKFHDINQGLPPKEALRDVYAIMTWFRDESIPGAQEYCRWVVEEINNGKKFIALKTIGAYVDKKTGEETPYPVYSRLFKALGLDYRGDWTDNPFVVEVVSKDSKMVEFERTLEDEVDVYENLKSFNPQNKIYLKLNRTDIEGGEAVAVVTTPTGGFALENYALYLNYADDRTRWRINPFEFFNEALGIAERPRFDTTTHLGRRIFYSHIDGDGVRNASEMELNRLASETVRDEILEKYPLPVTVSFITAEIDPDYFGSRRALEMAREVLALPNVEVGVHAFSHPLDWQKQLTSFVINGYSQKLDRSKADKDFIAETAYPTSARITVDSREYLDREIRQAVDYVNRDLAPAHKPVKLFQWSGNCRPPAEAIDLADSLGLANINGGDSRLDRYNPSYTSMAPLTRQAKGRIQVHTSNSNENIYTDGWDKNYHAFRQVIETFQQTERPTLIDSVYRRISPINVYYHFYAAEKKISLAALKEVYDYALSQPIVPLFTSEYVNVVKGFLSGEIEKTSDGGWRLSRFGQCRTVRFDHNARYPDFKKSRGVLGFIHWQNYLYVHLNDTDEALVYLTDEKPQSPYLAEAGNNLWGWTLKNNTIAFTTRGFREGLYRLGGLRPNSNYAVSLTASGRGHSLYQGNFTSDSEGQMEIRLPLREEARVKIEPQG